MLKPLTKRKRSLSFVLGAAVALGLAVSAHADTMTFNFNSLADGASNGTSASTSNSVWRYMQGVVDTAFPSQGKTVTVTGAVGENNYTGDNHVVGNGSTLTAVTLGPDTYIVNTTSNHNDRIIISFNFPINSVSFDLEIFPNASCPDGGVTGCPNNSSTNWPDFTLKAWTGLPNSSLVLSARTPANDPETPCWHSVYSGPIACEKAPQYLGYNLSYTFNQGVKTLEFIDWPAMIGIDNLKVNVPEPTSMILLGFGLIGLRAWASRRGRKEKR